MGVLRISQLEDSFVIYFQSDRERINAYTLASTLVAIADAAKAANASLNHGYDVEVVVEAVGPGSFKAKVRAVYSKARNLFSDHKVEAVVLGIIASYIYERTLGADDQVQVQVNTAEVVIVRGNDRIIVPRNVYDATRVVAQQPTFVSAVTRTVESAGGDEHVSGLALVPEMTSQPEVVLSKEQLQKVAMRDPTEEPPARVIEEQCDLQIIKAILERSRRKWEFVWRGIKIAAPILDDEFYAKFFAHRITIAPGDILRVRLSIKQSRDPDTGIYTNASYEVTQVLEHVAGARQMSLGDSSSDAEMTDLPQGQDRDADDDNDD
jgi:hypothetical protein